MRVFISYHRADQKYRTAIENLLRQNNISYYAVPENANFDGMNHQHIKDIINSKMYNCDVLLCIVGKETYSRPHVDWELHEALKGDINNRRGVLAVLLENRGDNKNDIDYSTFPNRLQDNEDHIVIEHYCSLYEKIVDALDEAVEKSRDRYIQTKNTRCPMQLRQGRYFDVN